MPASSTVPASYSCGTRGASCRATWLAQPSLALCSTHTRRGIGSWAHWRGAGWAGGPEQCRSDKGSLVLRQTGSTAHKAAGSRSLLFGDWFAGCALAVHEVSFCLPSSTTAPPDHRKVVPDGHLNVQVCKMLQRCRVWPLLSNLCSCCCVEGVTCDVRRPAPNTKLEPIP
jgi:hypothetical protein